MTNRYAALVAVLLALAACVPEPPHPIPPADVGAELDVYGPGSAVITAMLLRDQP